MQGLRPLSRLFLQVLLLIFSASDKSAAFLPEIEWHVALGGTQSDENPRVKQTKDGGYIIIGSSESPAWAGKKAPRHGGKDVWMVKVDANGSSEWDVSFGGNSNENSPQFDQTPDGGFVIGTSSTSGVSGNRTIPNGGVMDCWIIRLTESGEKIWEKSFGRNDGDGFSAIKVTSDGGTILVGKTTSLRKEPISPFDLSDAWILKLDEAGNKEWDRVFGGSSVDTAVAVVETRDGGYVIGGTSASAPGDNKTAPWYGAEDFWLLRLDTQGNRIWEKTYGGSFTDSLHTIRETVDGGLILGGSSNSPTNGTKTSPNFGISDFWIIKTDETGLAEWQTSFGTSGIDQLRSLISTPDGGYLLGGWLSSEIFGKKDYWVIKTDVRGVKEWEQIWGGTEADDLSDLITTKDGGIIICGTSASPLSGNKPIAGFGAGDFWLMKQQPPSGPIEAELSLKPDWLFDSIRTNEPVATITVDLPQAGEWQFWLAGGVGSTNNGKFKIVQNELWTTAVGPSALFDADLARTQFIRVRAVGSNGVSFEQALTLHVIDATPSARFELMRAFVSSPSYVNVIFRLTDHNGRGISLPESLLENPSAPFQIREDGAPISTKESFLQINKLPQVPAQIKTVLLLDNSSSLGLGLLKMREAASNLVERILPQQQIAICSFSGSFSVLHSFTRDKAALKKAIATIGIGNATTDLYGSLLDGLDMWQEVFSPERIETGFLVVFTDGSDTSGRSTLNSVIAKRNTEAKNIFTIGLGSEINPTVLQTLANAGPDSFKQISKVEDLAGAFSSIQQDIEQIANSFYWVNYASPKRGEITRIVNISLNSNNYSGPNSQLTTQFNSAGFTDVERGVIINRRAYAPEGIIETLTISPVRLSEAHADTVLPLADASPFYIWTVLDPSLVKVSPLDTNGATIRLVPSGRSGTTILTVRDTANSAAALQLGLPENQFTKTVQLVVGHGMLSSPQRSLDGLFAFNVNAEVGREYRIEVSSNLVTWEVQQTLQGMGSQVAVTFTNQQSSSQGYFRLATDEH